MTKTYEPPSLPTAPFESVNYHAGMELGVPELVDEQAYHRGKLWLHDAWLHGCGVVWGLSVKLADDNCELRVEPGLGLDSQGRELSLGASVCLDLFDWQETNRNQLGMGECFDAHVALVFDATLERAAAAMGQDELVSTRVREGARAVLRPGRAPSSQAYSRVRRLFEVVRATDPDPEREDDADPDTWRARIRKEGSRSRRRELYEHALRHLAALDGAEAVAVPPAYANGHAPDQASARQFPQQRELVLAELLGVTIEGSAIKHVRELSFAQRPAALSVGLLQDLLSSTLAAAAPARDSGGPRVRQVVMHAKRIVLDFDQPLLPASVDRRAFQVSVLREDGWHDVPVGAVEPATVEHHELDVNETVSSSYLLDLRHAEVQRVDITAVRSVVIGIDVVDYRSLTLHLGEQLRPGIVRVIAKGTGSRPLLSEGFVPLAGGYRDGAASLHGRDFVLQWTISAGS